MKPKDGVAVLVADLLMSLMFYGMLRWWTISVEFGHLFIGLVLIDATYYICKSLEKLGNYILDSLK